jgi:hypothetical protein
MQTETLAIILGSLFAVSESLALIPAVKSNSVFQLIYNLLKSAVGLFKKPPQA